MVGKPERRTDPRDSKRVTYTHSDPFNCALWCSDDHGQTLIPELQRSRRCTLPGFWRTWDDEPQREDVARLRVWMGSADRAGNRKPEPLSDGCPAGWAHSRYAESFKRYRRRRLENGGHDSNPRVHAGTPEHILDALAYYESEFARAESAFMEGIKK